MADDPCCAFNYERPEPYRYLGPGYGMNSGCQFTGETEFFPCDGKHYCRFHLPMKNAEKERTEKADWDDQYYEFFKEPIEQFIRTAMDDSERIDLTGVVFPRRYNFPIKKLSKDILFCDTKFSDGADFSAATFLGHAGFDCATFSGSAEFNKTTFEGSAEFNNTTFEGNANFMDAVFDRFTSYSYANAKFTCKAAKVDFSWSGVRVSGDDSDPAALGAFPGLDFSGGVIAGTANFSNRVFKEAANFSGRRFKRPPLFYGASLHPGTRWRCATFPNTTDPGAEQAYRTLRLDMEKIRDRPQEGIFFAHEQRAIRHQAKWRHLRKWLSYGYDLTSNYGQRAGRPLIWLASVFSVFMASYWLTGVVLSIDGMLIRDLFGFTIQQVVKPFALWTPTRGGGEFLSNFSDVAQFWFRIAATVQSLLSLVLITLFILALRWQFRRG